MVIESLTLIETRPRLNHDAAMIGSCRHQPPPSSRMHDSGKARQRNLNDEELQEGSTLPLDSDSDAIVGRIKVTIIPSRSMSISN